MSFEVFGTSGDDGVDADDLYRDGWESDADCEKWWKSGEPDEVYTFQQAVAIYEEGRFEDDYDIS